MPYTSVKQDGFEFAFNRFLTGPGRTARVEPHVLRDMFLPKLTPAAKKVLRDNYYFVSAQLKHYGVDYDENELTGNGTNFLKKILAAGKIDKVPHHIEQLRLQMSAEWHDQLTLEEMVDGFPEWLIEKHFLDRSGRPDRTKTTEVLVVPLPAHSTYRVSKVTDAADRVSGLHYDRRRESLYIGWDQVAVRAAAEGHEERIERQKTKEKNDRDQKRNAMHAEYLQKARAKHAKGDWSPAGSFIVDCDAIKNDWPDSADDMTLDIYETDQHGIFSATFDFGVVEGAMILSSGKAALQEYCDRLEREAALENHKYYEEDVEDEEESDTYSKRKATAERDQSPKKQKVEDGNPRQLFLQWKGMETGEGEILYLPEEGSITFGDEEFSAFTGNMDIVFVGRKVPFTALKVSESGGRGSSESWNDFSFAAHEAARIGRWK